MDMYALLWAIIQFSLTYFCLFFCVLFWHSKLYVIIYVKYSSPWWIFLFVCLFLALSYFLALQHAPGSFHRFLALLLESVISLRSPAYFYKQVLRMVLGTKV